MKKITALTYDKRIFLAGYFLFVVLAGCLLLFLSKADGFLWLNKYHNTIFDWFFKIYTVTGDGFFSLAIFLMLFFAGYRLISLQVIIAYAVSGILSPIFKRIFSTPRPRAFLLEHHIDYPYIDSITLAGYTSFPSGHSISVFALATILACNTKNKWLQFFYLIAAILTGYSRVYLGAHFPEDVLGGSLIGVAVAFAVHFSFSKKNNGNLKNINPV